MQYGIWIYRRPPMLGVPARIRAAESAVLSMSRKVAERILAGAGHCVCNRGTVVPDPSPDTHAQLPQVRAQLCEAHTNDACPNRRHCCWTECAVAFDTGAGGFADFGPSQFHRSTALNRLPCGSRALPQVLLSSHGCSSMCPITSRDACEPALVVCSCPTTQSISLRPHA